MLSFEEFQEHLKNNILDFLPNNYAGSVVELHEVVKNNETFTGLIVRREEVNISPTIYLNPYYQLYINNNMDLDAILEKIASVYAEHVLDNNFDVSKITDFEQVKDNIIAKVFGTEHNEQILSNKPYRMMADLAVTYHIMLEENADGVVSVPITESLMNEWGVTEDVLFTASKNNMSRLTPVVVKGMFETLCDMQGAQSLEFIGIPSVDPADEMMFVMYNTSKLYGAAAMIDPNNMEYARNLIQSDFYILPSSVHEGATRFAA